MPALWRFGAQFLLCVICIAAVAGLPVAVVAAPSAEDADGVELPSALTQKEALLTIFYDASTFGELHPCPT